MNIESRIRSKSKSLTTAIIMVLILSGTAMIAASSYAPGSVHAQQQATINVIMNVVCNPTTTNCPSPSQLQ